MTYFDITDLLVFLAANKSVSGIQRVVSRFVAEVEKRGDREGAIWCTADPLTSELVRLMPADVEELVALVDRHDSTRAEIDRQLTLLEKKATPAQPNQGDVYMILGAFWIVRNTPSIVSAMKLRGVLCGMLLYDLIPINSPEYCSYDLVKEFRFFLDSLLPNLDFLLAISEHTARETKAYISASGLPEIPIHVMPLGLELLSDREGVAQASRNSRLLDGVPFVLAVGTLEVRKNHTYLFAIWRRLLSSYPREAVPKLVLVGRRGWLIDDFLAQLVATEQLNGHIVIIDDASDTDLHWLYSHCLFTCFVSFVEGWGLPVGESLSFGKVCVASNSSSIPEVVGPLAVYVDPLNVHDGLRVVSELITHPEALTAREAIARAEFKPRTWSEVATDLLTSVKSFAATVPRDYMPVKVRARCWTSFGVPVGGVSPTAMTPIGSVNASQAGVSGWHSPEPWGRWASASDSRLLFRMQTAGRVVIVFRLRRHTGEPAHLRIVQPDNCLYEGVLASGDTFIPVECPSTPDATIDITFSVSSPIVTVGADQRRLYVGITDMFIYGTDTLEDRVFGMQDLVLQQLNI